MIRLGWTGVLCDKNLAKVRAALGGRHQPDSRQPVQQGAVYLAVVRAKALKKHDSQRGGHPNELPDEPAVLS